MTTPHRLRASRRSRLICRAALAGLLLPGATACAAAGTPNFVVINIDDLGYGDIAPFGSRLNRTPQLDRMAREGRRLDSFYAAPVCSPSRAALLTGCYPKRVLPIQGVLHAAGAGGLNPAEVTVAELLAEAGYATACIGKWHLGDQPEFLPTRQGFQYYLGIPYSNNMGATADGARNSLGEEPPRSQPAGAEPEFPLPLLENETVIARLRQDGQQGIVERYTGAAVAYLRQHQDRRFFLYLAHTAVHFPIYPGKAWAHRSPHGIYSDWVEEVDWSVGQVLQALRDLHLDANTLVIFTSDNGATTSGTNAPLRGYKRSTWEGAMRVPTIAWWPGRIPGGTATDEICGMMDILPTLAKLGGGRIPADRKIDGADIWPLLAGASEAKSPHAVFYYYRGLTLEGVRAGPWKLRLAAADGPAAKDRLFNLQTDLGESTDVAAANPEVVQRLHRLAGAMKEDLGLDGIGPGCRPLGRVENPQPLIDLDGTIRPGFSHP